jgi:hypothetical protein
MRREFSVHRLNTSGLVAADQIAEAFSECLDKVSGFIPPGRELGLVVTKLQEAAFFAKRAMALVPRNQQSGT